ncbi:MAG: hypothetical protein EBV86_11570, partial [Marivivens sp.]|nr:hypothetical protein [Marivivens sp.]
MITTTPRAVLLSLMTGIGDPLVVRPSDLHSNLQRAILGVLARRGAGTNTVTIEDDLAGYFDREEVKQEVRVCYMGEQAYSDAQYAALVERLHREASVAALKRGANAVLERLGDGETPEQVASVVASMLEATRPEVADEVEEVGERVADLFEIDDTTSVPLGLDCMADL